ncbi:MAG TPA: hypothetical protein VFA04_22165, partial [Bryobacteraceae bacterium]|nr:hypothetical protein [Bryobacteraceae bacterium]
MSTSPIALPRSHAFVRMLLPSLGDLLLVAIVFWLFCAQPDSWSHFMGDANTGLHIRTGDYILAHGSVPHSDLYSFSRPDGAWFSVEWLSCVIYSALHRVWGLTAVAFLSAILLVAWPMVQLRDCYERGANMLLSVVLVFAGMRAAAIHYLARPHLFTMVCTALAAWFIARERRNPTRAVWMLIPFTVLWTNLHGAFVVLLAYLGLLAVGSFLEHNFTQSRRWDAMLAACCAASLINPYGINLHLHIVSFLGSSAHMVQEYAPAATFLGNGYVEVFFGLLGVAAVCSVAMLLRRQFVEPLWIAFFGWLAVTSARNITVFVIIAVPIIAREVTRWLPAVSKEDNLGRSLSVVTPWGAGAACAILLWTAPISFSPAFPAGIVQRDATVLTGSRLFTTDHWGDYLLYRLWPRQRVFIDGRSDYYADLGIDYLTMIETDHGWQKTFEKWGFNAALLPSDNKL